MAVKAPPSPPAPAPYTWTGFYAGIQFGGGWSHEAVNYPASALLLSGGFTMTSQPVANGYRIPVRITALVPFAETTPASFNAAFHDRFNVVRLGLNYRFDEARPRPDTIIDDPVSLLLLTVLWAHPCIGQREQPTISTRWPRLTAAAARELSSMADWFARDECRCRRAPESLGAVSLINFRRAQRTAQIQAPR
jgi:hypothetical protein